MHRAGARGAGEDALQDITSAGERRAVCRLMSCMQPGAGWRGLGASNPGVLRLSCSVPPYAMRSVPEYAGLVNLEEQRYPPPPGISRRGRRQHLQASRQVTTGLASGRNQPWNGLSRSRVPSHHISALIEPDATLAIISWRPGHIYNSEHDSHNLLWDRLSWDNLS